MSETEHILEQELEERFRFEALMADLSAGFIRLAATQMDGAIENAQRAVCEHLDLDRSALFQRCDKEPEKLLLTHLYQRDGVEAPPVERRAGPNSTLSSIWVLENTDGPQYYAQIDANAVFPWMYQRLRRRETMVVHTPDDLPSEATCDKERLLRYGTRSTVVVPLFIGADWLGCLTFASMRESRHWSPLLVRRFEFVANVFTNALARKHADHALGESEERLALATESAGAGLWSIEIEDKSIWVTPRTRELFGLRPDEELSLEDLLRRVHSEDADHVRLDFQNALQTGAELFVDFRIVPPDGNLRWISARGRRHCDASGKPKRLTGASVDITQRKHAEETLARSYEEIKQLKDRLQAESDYLKGEIKLSQAHAEIIGRSAAIKEVLHLVEQVAAAACPVLVSGETGTGKELVAQEIHRLSSRRDRVMVLVNCAALPTALVESELFGRERGAYTGALTSQVGNFEIANGSTIFLDEVGELSMEVQAKLLRVLQEGEFQRLGSPKTHKVDVRVIAATNRDIAQEVRDGRFREDLYYRLNVFPIVIPPLRDHIEDIPALVFAFLEEFSTRMGKKVTKVPRKAMEVLEAYAWPGNIRELRNVIEHSVILASGDMLKLPALGDAPTREVQPVTLFEAERDHILKTLERTGWRIKGPHGAATRLGLQPSTLYSRMQKLGIPHRRQKDEMSN